MKVFFFIVSIFILQYSYSQTAEANLKKCAEAIEKWYSSNNVDKKYLEDLPPRKGQATLKACDGWATQRCIKHKRSCFCSECGPAMEREEKALEAEYERRRTACEKTYQKEYSEEQKRKKEEKEQIDRERKEEEEKQKREEKEQIDRERKAEEEKQKREEKEQIDRERKAEEEKAKSNQNLSTNSSTNSSSSKSNTSSNDYTINRFQTNQDLKKSSKAVADYKAQEGNSFISTIFEAGDLFGGAKFVNSNFGLNLTISPISIRNVPVWSNLDMYSYILNRRTNGSIKSSALTFYGYYLEAELYILNNKFSYLKGIGSLSNSYSDLGGDYSGNHTVNESHYGGEAAIGHNPIKIYVGYYKGKRDVSYNFQDNTDVNTYSLQSGNGSYDFNRKYTGVIISFNKENEDDVMERFVKIEAILEKPSLKNNNQFFGGALTWRMWLDINLEYFPKYHVAGNPLYTITNSNDKTFWNVRIGKTFTLFKGKY